MQGRIIKGIAGFYYVKAGNTLYECKAKGLFRKNREKPLVGDLVIFSELPDEENTGNIEAILERKNRLIRPEIANVDQLFILFAARSPEPNFEMLTRYILMLEKLEIPISLVVSKCDLAEEETLEQYRRDFSGSSYPMYTISVREESGIEDLKEALAGRVTAFAGPSGVGKSTLMNYLLREDVMETGGLSRRIERGKNTTRHSELFEIAPDTYVFDTPGFTSVELNGIEKEDLAFYFPEFDPYLNRCRFHMCMHLSEPGCAVKEAVERGEISRLRYESYSSVFRYISSQRRY